MDDMVTTSSGIVPITMTLGTVTDRMVTIVTGAFSGETDGESRFFGGTTVFILTDHGHLLHGMQNVTEFQIRMFSMDFIGTFDAQIKRWWTIGSI